MKPIRNDGDDDLALSADPADAHNIISVYLFADQIIIIGKS